MGDQQVGVRVELSVEEEEEDEEEQRRQAKYARMRAKKLTELENRAKVQTYAHTNTYK
jgi:hypothetical protein